MLAWLNTVPLAGQAVQHPVKSSEDRIQGGAEVGISQVKDKLTSYVTRHFIFKEGWDKNEVEGTEKTRSWKCGVVAACEAPEAIF